MTTTNQATFTKEYMKHNCGCYSEERLMNCSFMKNESITIENILQSEIRLKDKFWFVCKRVLTKKQNKLLAIGVSEIVLHIYENKCPDDNRPREAIQAAKDYLAGVINIDQLRSHAHAAAAAYAAAYDAYDASAAAYDASAAASAASAAHAAYAAAASAASAAHAAYAAASASAASAAYDDGLQQTLLSYLINFCNDL